MDTSSFPKESDIWEVVFVKRVVDSVEDGVEVSGRLCGIFRGGTLVRDHAYFQDYK